MFIRQVFRRLKPHSTNSVLADRVSRLSITKMSDSASPAAEMNEISPETAKLSDVPSSKTEVDDALPQPNDTCDVPSPTADTNEAPSPTGEVNDGSSPDDELSNPRSPTTRTREFSAEKGKYLEMPIEEKRELYRVKKFVELKDIPTWQSYYCEREDCLRKDYDKDLAEIADSSPTKNVELNEKISLWQGDITFLEVDAIVNAANSSLLGGGGVDGAIHRAAGPFLKKECSTLNGCETGDAKITGGYKLPAKYVIHTVGPKGEDSDLLKSCYTRSLELMLENNIRTIAFPCISTGIYGYPQDSAANVALSTVRTFLEKNAEKVDRIIFTLFLDEDVEIYETLTQVYFPIQSQDSPKE